MFIKKPSSSGAGAMHVVRVQETYPFILTVPAIPSSRNLLGLYIPYMASDAGASS